MVLEQADTNTYDIQPMLHKHVKQKHTSIPQPYASQPSLKTLLEEIGSKMAMACRQIIEEQTHDFQSSLNYK